MLATVVCGLQLGFDMELSKSAGASALAWNAKAMITIHCTVYSIAGIALPECVLIQCL
jgi:hypothetical protein